jgi:hypothetical protein
MLRVFRSAVILFCLVAIPVRANLGESVEQCVKRYGKPIGFSEANGKLPFGTVDFTAGPYTLIVFLLNNKEVGARVSKKDKSDFTDDEIKTIMDADAGGSAWTPTVSDVEGCSKWLRNDKATVFYDHEKHILIFTADEMAKALHPAAARPPPTGTPGPSSVPAPAPVNPAQ